MDTLQNFTALPVDGLAKQCGQVPLSAPSPLLLSAIAALETVALTIIEDGVMEHEVMAASGVKKGVKEGRLSCQQLQLGLHRRRFSALFASEAPSSLFMRKLCNSFLDAASEAMLKGGDVSMVATEAEVEDSESAAGGAGMESRVEGGGGEAPLSPSSSPPEVDVLDATASALRGSSIGPLSRESVDAEAGTNQWQRRRDDVITEKHLTLILKYVNPAFSFTNDALMFLLAFNREALRILSEAEKDATPATASPWASGDDSAPTPASTSASDTGVAALPPALAWVPQPLHARCKEQAETLAAAVSGSRALPPTVRLQIRILRSNGSVAHSSNATVPRSDSFNEYLNVACKQMYVERKDHIFLYGAGVVEGSMTPEDLCLLPRSTLFGVPKTWWDNARREEGRRGVLTAPGKPLEASGSRMNVLKARSTGASPGSATAAAITLAPVDVGVAAADAVGATGDATASSDTGVPPPDRIKAGLSSLKRPQAGGATATRVTRPRIPQPPPGVLHDRDSSASDGLAGGGAAASAAGSKLGEGGEVVPDAPGVASYRPIVASSATRLPVLSPERVAALQHTHTGSESKTLALQPSSETGARLLGGPGGAASSRLRTRLIKTPSVGARAGATGDRGGAGTSAAVGADVDLSRIDRLPLPTPDGTSDYGTRFQSSPHHTELTALPPVLEEKPVKGASTRVSSTTAKRTPVGRSALSESEGRLGSKDASVPATQQRTGPHMARRHNEESIATPTRGRRTSVPKQALKAPSLGEHTTFTTLQRAGMAKSPLLTTASSTSPRSLAPSSPEKAGEPTAPATGPVILSQAAASALADRALAAIAPLQFALVKLTAISSELRLAGAGDDAAMGGVEAESHAVDLRKVKSALQTVQTSTRTLLAHMVDAEKKTAFAAAHSTAAVPAPAPAPSKAPGSHTKPVAGATSKSAYRAGVQPSRGGGGVTPARGKPAAAADSVKSIRTGGLPSSTRREAAQVAAPSAASTHDLQESDSVEVITPQEHAGAPREGGLATSVVVAPLTDTHASDTHSTLVALASLPASALAPAPAPAPSEAKDGDEGYGDDAWDSPREEPVPSASHLLEEGKVADELRDAEGEAALPLPVGFATTGSPRGAEESKQSDVKTDATDAPLFPFAATCHSPSPLSPE